MTQRHLRFFAMALAAALGLLLAACGGAAPTATPAPTRAAPASPTSAPTPTTPPTAPAATATRAAPTATPAPTSTRPPTPPQVKRGGILQLRSLPGFPLVWDTYNFRGWVEEHNFGPLMNNLIWLAPYTKGLEGDTAEKWDLSADGKAITFTLRKGIKFHDGAPFTAKDVVYNIERGWKPRDRDMTFFKARFVAMESVQALDDFTVRLTLSTPSNVLFRSLAMSPSLMFPAHFPFPEKQADWKKSPVGTGPYKFKSYEAGIKMEYLRNEGYWKPGLPYLDGIVITSMDWSSTGIAAFRTGKLDATNLDSPAPTEADLFKKSQGFTAIKTNVSINPVILNQRPPFTDPRVREAIDLAMDRHALASIWLEGNGSPYAPPMLPPELGGQFGISVEQMKNRPGYRQDKAQDLARAKQLLAQAGVDPAKTSVDVVVGSGYTNAQVFAETAEASIRALGFKPNLAIVPSAEQTSRLQRGDFDLDVNTMSMHFDDPKEYLEPRVATGGFANTGKWSNQKIDAIIAEQDRTLDLAKRRQMLLELQDIILTDRAVIPLVVRFGYHGYMPWLKNFPTNVDFLHDSIFRWEQVWLDRG